jgi:DNA repair protein RadC
VLELALFYAIPRRDTNELAHILIERFGSFRGVLDAEYDELVEVEGVGENAALFITFFREIFRYYRASRNDTEYVYDTIGKLGTYAVNLYTGMQNEKCYALLFDNNMKMLATILVSEGSVSSTNVNIPFIIEKIMKKKATTVVLVHNHPSGRPFPSQADEAITSDVATALNICGCTLLEHIIVGGEYFYPMLRSRTKAGLPMSHPALSFNSFYGEAQGGAMLAEPMVEIDD